MQYPTGSDPQRLPKGGMHSPTDMMGTSDPVDKPGYVKPGGGRNQDLAGKDAMPGFEDLQSYKSTQTPTSGTDFGQDTYPPANKSAGPSSGR